MRSALYPVAAGPSTGAGRRALARPCRGPRASPSTAPNVAGQGAPAAPPRKRRIAGSNVRAGTTAPSPACAYRNAEGDASEGADGPGARRRTVSVGAFQCHRAEGVASPGPSASCSHPSTVPNVADHGTLIAPPCEHRAADKRTGGDACALWHFAPPAWSDENAGAPAATERRRPIRTLLA